MKANKKLTIVAIFLMFTLLLSSLASAKTEIDDKKLEKLDKFKEKYPDAKIEFDKNTPRVIASGFKYDFDDKDKSKSDIDKAIDSIEKYLNKKPKEDKDSIRVIAENFINNQASVEAGIK